MDEHYHTDPPKRSPNLKRYALSYAAKGIAVFPCKLDKSPLTPHGFHDATTDPDVVTKWWEEYPDASIGAPTGMVNRWVVPDLDEETHEAMKLWHSLPETLTVKTGRASGKGRHRYYSITEPTPTRKLAGGAIDLKGDGGYIILPPSGHTSGNRYEWLHRATIAPLPEELSSGGHEETRSSDQHSGGPRRYEDDGGPIPKGQRDDALASIGGLLRAQGYDEGDILDELLAVNESRCEPPLPPKQVRKVARSVSRYPKGKMPKVDPNAGKALDDVQRAMWEEVWPNKSDRDVVISLIKVGKQFGKYNGHGGVEVPISYRELAVEAAVSLRTVRKSLERLGESGWVRKGERGSGTRRGTLVLAPRAQVPHSNHTESSIEHKDSSVVPLRSPRLRHSATLPVMRRGRRIDTLVLLRLGKTAGAVIDVLDTHGPTVTVDDIADILGVKRPRDLRRRIIQRLVDRGIVSVGVDDDVTLVENWMEALETERSITGEKFAEAYWRKRYKEQREAYRGRHKLKAHRFSMAQMWDRLPRPTSELQRVPDPHPELVTILRLWSESRPHFLEKYPSWLATYIWSEELASFRPTPLDVEVALYEVSHGRRAA